MLADAPRTLAYQKAILDNKDFFHGKTVMDVGAGTGRFQCYFFGKKKCLNQISKMLLNLINSFIDTKTSLLSYSVK